MSIHVAELCTHRWMTLCKGLHDEPFIRERGGGALIVAINDSAEVLLVTEPAISDGAPVLWLPAGALEAGEAPTEAANRELQEEIGFKAERLDVLAELRPLARHAEWSLHAVLARDLSPNDLAGDEPHKILTQPFGLARFEELVDAGRLRDSSCIAALFLARRFLARESISRPQDGQQEVGG